MSTNKIKPSDLTAWAGDKSMAIHAHKPGVSQQVTVQEIIDAVPVPDIDGSEIEAAKVAAIDAKDQAVIAKDAAAASRQSAFTYYEASKAWSESADDAYRSAMAWSERAQAWAEAPKGAVINNEGSSAKHWALIAQDIADGIEEGGSGGGFPGENVDDPITHDTRKAWATVSAMAQADGRFYDLDDPRGKHVLHPGISTFLGGNMPIATSPSPIIVGWNGNNWGYNRHDGNVSTMRVESYDGLQRPAFWSSYSSGFVHVVGGLYSKVRIHSGHSDLSSYINLPGYTTDLYSILETIPAVDATWWLYDVFVKGDKTKSPNSANYECVQNLTVNYTKAGDPDGDIVRTFTRKLNGSAGSFKSNWKLVDSGSSGGGSEGGGGLPGGDVNDSLSSDIPLAWATVSALPYPHPYNSSPVHMPYNLDISDGKSILYAGSQPYSGGAISEAYSTSPCIFAIGNKAQQHVGGAPLDLLIGDKGNALPYVDNWDKSSIILSCLKSIFYPKHIDSEPVFEGYLRHSAIVETTPTHNPQSTGHSEAYNVIVNKMPTVTPVHTFFECIQELTIVWAPEEGYYGEEGAGDERTSANRARTITRKYRRVVGDAVGRFEGGNWKLIAEL